MPITVTPVSLDEVPGDDVNILALAAGYYSLDSHITATNFPRRKYPLDWTRAVLVGFDGAVPCDFATILLEEQGVTPGHAHETLWLGMQKPDLLRMHPIVALGHPEIVNGTEKVVYATHSKQQPAAHTIPRSSYWLKNTLFFGFAKP